MVGFVHSDLEIFRLGAIDVLVYALFELRGDWWHT
jgi:hypothetical protein